MSRLPLSLSGALLLGLALARPFTVLGQEVDLTALTLRQAEALLQTKNRELQAARRAVEAAGAGTLAAGARPNPTLSLGVSSINLKEGVGSGSPSEKIVDSNVRIDQVIERGDKRELRLASARSLESASNADLSEAQRQQRLALRSAYYDLLLAQDKVDIARDTISLFEGSVRAAELRLKAGDIAAADVARLRVDALRAQNDARAAEADRRRAQLALAYMIGAESAAIGIRAVDPWPSIYGERPGGSVDELIEARPDVRAAKSRFEAAQNARELARSLRTRDVSVGASFDHYPVNPGFAQGSGAGTGNTFGVFLSVPLFIGNKYEGEIARAEVDYGAAMEGLEKVRARRAPRSHGRSPTSRPHPSACSATTNRCWSRRNAPLNRRNSPTRTARSVSWTCWMRGGRCAQSRLTPPWRGTIMPRRSPPGRPESVVWTEKPSRMATRGTMMGEGMKLLRQRVLLLAAALVAAAAVSACGDGDAKPDIARPRLENGQIVFPEGSAQVNSFATDSVKASRSEERRVGKE